MTTTLDCGKSTRSDKPNNYDYGDAARMFCDFTDDNNDPANPSGVLLRYKAPDATITVLTFGTDAELTNPRTGHFQADITMNQEGTWTFRFEGTGTIIAANERNLFVRDSVFY